MERGRGDTRYSIPLIGRNRNINADKEKGDQAKLENIQEKTETLFVVVLRRTSRERKKERKVSSVALQW